MILRSIFRGLAIVLATGVCAAGCAEAVFHCSQDEACDHGGRGGGVCISPGYCAFDSEECATGLAYGSLSPPDLAGECVPVSDGSESGAPPEASSGGESSEDDGVSLPATSPATGGSGSEGAEHGSGSACPAGEPCDPADPCVLEATCAADGTCVPTDMVECDEPPGPCVESLGTCGPLGTCEYAPLPAGDACDDGDPCTEDDTCDGAGACTPGELCPSDNPCETRTCVQFACVSMPHADGTSCGPEAADRCCSGNCVDISSDTAHCGGCDTACAPGLDCESVSETNTCEVSPAATSGRCRCQFSNAQCPNGQICRTYAPYTDRCVPPSEDNCAGTAVYQNSCPSFCTYET